MEPGSEREEGEGGLENREIGRGLVIVRGEEEGGWDLGRQRKEEEGG